MSLFRYSAYDTAGKKRHGSLEAENAAVARQQLRDLGLLPVTLEESHTGGQLLGSRLRGEIWPFTRQLATLLTAGLPLTESLDALAREQTQRGMRSLVIEIKEAVQQGESLSDALGRYPRLFNSLYVNMVGAGEASGTLDIVLERLADYGERQQEVSARIRAALLYPAFVCLLGGAILTFLFIYIVPKVTVIFTEMEQALPWPTRLLLAISDFLGTFWLPLVVLIVLTILGGRALFQQPQFRARLDPWLFRLPLAGALTRTIIIARLADNLGSLLANGVTLNQALGIIKNMFHNSLAVTLLEQMHTEVTHGGSLAGAMRQSGWIPASVVQMVAAGERSNTLDGMLAKIARRHERQTEHTITALTSLIEPAMIVVMGGVIGFIVLAILLPIFDLQRLIQ